ncbi:MULTISPECIES: acyl-CoA dehydrogenase family protein [unclassified Mycolicibacterium]|uniref:acyl-CoA dehydrogenase family protein n=1 Tax=unclassified Mycolicibacterium TaxID=2636767 RepID=UPI0012DF75D8|nr:MULTISPECIES: acyl-CoA dehydrogenase family protein [unclassified Mycolicibacterium]MUL83628.1 acyl-CoA dehydrogenase [Mycolicibacterium sp. CBMA 329]MUL90619.1 acyl-CoA dehydrogenase [Mycolicibacterium sp. CBMA 331]MUM00589.1 acyl-CoA dehydrogenase [Mycolicibacterium sp. CBMA 334]MUM25480.1 acyl-CoA dehydrogenase [Mycolicibacterium sp. CBMA 295]MUM41563.1 acyl-CoA dehydrogenase [Mycolicibacterium sp. CBMA 247]
MTTESTYLKRPTGYDAELRSVFAPIFERIAEGNREREANRVFPREQVRWLNDAGFGTLRISAEQGGFGASLEQTFLLLSELGEADANVAHIWRNHLAFVEDRLNAPVSEDNTTWIKRFLAGEFVGGGWTEANNLTLANLATTVAEEDGHWLVTGAKYYATGSLYADWLDVLGRGEGGELWTALVRADDPGVTLIDDWRGFGQRTTGSGSARYQQARAERGNVFPAVERFTYQAQFYQIAMLAVLTGIIRAVQRDGSAVLSARTRNYPQGLAEVPAADPQLLQVIGELSAEAFGATAALGQSARSLDRIVTGRLAGSDGQARQLLVDAEVAVTQAQLVIVAAALRATTRVFDALGASGVSEGLGLDRHWRNARTLASHNPVVYKARILGDWFINRKDPVADLVSRGRGGQGN